MLPPWLADPAGFIALVEKEAAEEEARSRQASVSPEPEDDRDTDEEPRQ